MIRGRLQYRPLFKDQSGDVAIIDAAGNGIPESMEIAAMASAFAVNIAPHNFSDLSAH